MTRLEALHALFATLFGADIRRLRRFIEYGNEGKEVLLTLPGPEAPANEQIASAISQLQTRRMINDTLERLQQDFPHWRAEIESVAVQWSHPSTSRRRDEDDRPGTARTWNFKPHSHHLHIYTLAALLLGAHGERMASRSEQPRLEIGTSLSIERAIYNIEPLLRKKCSSAAGGAKRIRLEIDSVDGVIKIVARPPYTFTDLENCIRNVIMAQVGDSHLDLAAPIVTTIQLVDHDREEKEP